MHADLILIVIIPLDVNTFLIPAQAVLGRNWPRYDQEKAREGSPSSFSNNSEKIEARDAREFISAVGKNIFLNLWSANII